MGLAWAILATIRPSCFRFSFASRFNIRLVSNCSHFQNNLQLMKTGTERASNTYVTQNTIRNQRRTTSPEYSYPSMNFTPEGNNLCSDYTAHFHDTPSSGSQPKGYRSSTHRMCPTSTGHRVGDYKSWPDKAIHSNNVQPRGGIHINHSGLNVLIPLLFDEQPRPSGYTRLLYPIHHKVDTAPGRCTQRHKPRQQQIPNEKAIMIQRLIIHSYVLNKHPRLTS